MVNTPSYPHQWLQNCRLPLSCCKCSNDAAVSADLNEMWVEQAGPQKWPLMHRLTQMSIKLLKHEAPPSDPNQPLPTPTPAVWDSIHTALEKVIAVQDFLQGVEVQPRHQRSVGSGKLDYVSFRKELAEMPYNLVAGHLPNLDLDVTKIMR